MGTSDVIALGSVVIAIVSLVISALTSTKKYELSNKIRGELLDWYRGTVEVLIAIRLLIEEDNFSGDKAAGLRAELSAAIEQGRFYFPNVDKRDGKGKQNPKAYRGYRNIVLEFLVYSYDISGKPDAKKYTGHLWQLQRLFTSAIFDVLSPYNHNKKVKKYTGVTYDSKIAREDYLKQNPEQEGYFKF